MTHEIDKDGIGEDALDRRLASLTRDAEPADSVWAGIEQRIRTPARRGRAAPLAALAAALVAVIAALQWMPDPDRVPDNPGRTLVQAEAEAMRRAAPIMTGGLTDAAPLSEAWAENQTAIEELEAALERDPDNRLLLDFLAEARLRQVRLLNSGLALTPQTEA